MVETVVKERRASGEREGSGERGKSKTLHFLLRVLEVKKKEFGDGECRDWVLEFVFCCFLISKCVKK